MNARLGPWLVSGVAAALACAALWISLAPKEAPGTAPPRDAAAPAGDPLEALRDELRQEQIEREQLAAELELMRAVIEQLAEAAPPGPDAIGEDEEVAAAPETAAAESEELDPEVLERIGMTEREVEALRARWDEAQLARLELNDEAAREGWLFKPRHRKQLAALEADLRAELGDEDYERMLYATERKNRVVVRNVIRGSAAERAGIQAGDHLLSYAGERTFFPREVGTLTRSGTKGESVRVELLRDGRRISVRLPRGPLGIGMTALSVPPGD